jgi:hypothetical protein
MRYQHSGKYTPEAAALPKLRSNYAAPSSVAI